MPVEFDKRYYRHRIPIEIMFGRLKELPRCATRYDRRPAIFFSAIAFAVVVVVVVVVVFRL